LAMGIKQILTRRVHRSEDIAFGTRDVYHVTNVMTLKDGTVLVAHSYFDRVE
jgi:hypothetical protein